MVDAAAIKEYLRLGSVPVLEAQASLPQDAGKSKRKRPTPVNERIWYTTNNARRGKSTVEAAVDATLPPKARKGSKNPGRKAPPRSKKTTKPAGRNSPAQSTGKNKVPVNNPVNKPPKKPTKKIPPPPPIPLPPTPPPALIDGPRCIARIIDNLLPEQWDHFPGIITLEDLTMVYERVVVPWPLNHTRDSFMNRMAKILDPDPFMLRRRGRQRWLDGVLGNKYMSVLKDDNYERGLPTVCNMGAAGFAVMEGTLVEGVAQRNRMPVFINATFGVLPFTRHRLIYLYLCFLIFSLLYKESFAIL